MKVVKGKKMEKVKLNIFFKHLFKCKLQFELYGETFLNVVWK